MNKSHAEGILSNFYNKRILVVGDVMLDEYIWGNVSRVSPEAPVIVVNAERQTQVPGGAANVVNNLCALGATGIIVGIVGDDPAGASLAAALEGEGAETTGLVRLKDRPTTRKTRIIAHSQQVVRVDHEQRSQASAGTATELGARITELAKTADAVLVSDYQKGVVSPTVLTACIDAARDRGCSITGNLKPAAVVGNSALTVLTLNLIEASTALGGRSLQTDQEVEDAGRALLDRTGSENILITRGSEGLTLIPAAGPSAHVPARPVEVYDVAGAGDTVIATLTLSLAAGATILEAVTIANHAAAEAVKKVGVSTVGLAEVLRSFDD